MGTRRKPTPYKIPSVHKGDKLWQYSLKWDVALITAAQEVSRSESERLGSRIGVPALITNFLLHDSNPEVAAAKKAFNERYKLLKGQEKQQREADYKKELEAAGLK